MWYPTEGPDYICVVPYCRDRAIVRVNVGTKENKIWQHMCLVHYDEHHTTIARRWCADRGLNTIDKQRAFISEILKNGKIGKGGSGMREPGSDEGYIFTE